MADISSITLPGGGTYDLKDKNAVPKYGMGKNLLRNWYFVGGGTGRGIFPVNQRGQSSYSRNSYSIDGWLVNNTNNFGVSISSSSLTLTSLSYTGVFFQYIPHVQFGKQYTASVMFSDGSMVVATGQINDSSEYIRVTFGGGALVVYYDKVQMQCFGGNSYGVVAAKLELGSEQTLAHQENGVWVMNEIPDYEYELYRCMTSTADSSDTYANKVLSTNIPNKNLLDNAYFVGGGSQLGDGIFPINQRGQTQYTLSSRIYTLDRWRAYKYSGSSTVNLTADGLEFSGQDCSFAQKVKVNQEELLGKTVTLSALIDGNLLSKTEVMPTSFSQHSTVINIKGTGINVALVSRPTPEGWTNAYYVSLGTMSTTVKVIKAVKLEFGTEQTLAHQENGVWVLNEIPDYGEELRKCQRYLFVLTPMTDVYGFVGFALGNNSTAIGANGIINLPTTMVKKSPTASISGDWRLWDRVAGTTLTITSISYMRLTQNAISAVLGASGIVAGRVYEIVAYNDTTAKLIFSCEL